MKSLLKILLVLCLISQSTYTYSQHRKNSTDYTIVSKYDALKLISKNDFEFKGREIAAAVFWENVASKNKTVDSFIKAVDRKKDSAVEVLRKIQKTSWNEIKNACGYIEISEEDCTNFYSYLTRVCLSTDDAPITKKIRFHLIKDGSLNACAYPNGDICITTGLYNILTPEEMAGVIAHEITHYVLLHSYTSLWKQIKKQKRSRNWAMLGYAMIGAADTYAASAGINMDRNYDQLLNDMMTIADNYSYKNRLFYPREDEIEADVTAYRFLEFVGIDGSNYINALRKIGTEYDAYYNRYSWDHPTTTYRINALLYLGSLK